MRLEAAEGIVRALIYEGYVLYPYRASSLKNQRRWTFGCVFPEDYTRVHDTGDREQVVTECLIEGGPESVLEVRARFLQVTRRTVLELATPVAELSEPLPAHRKVTALQLGHEQHRSWEEGIERDLRLGPVSFGDLAERPLVEKRRWEAERELEALRTRPGAPVVGAFLRERSALSARFELSLSEVREGLWRARVVLRNETPWVCEGAERPREVALQQALVSAHTLLGVSGGAQEAGGFVSLLEPAAELEAEAEACENTGTWPVLVGPQGARDTLLSSPIVLYDYPEVAPQSPGDLFDATEIDEILTLRIQTMTPAERAEAMASDPLTRGMLERAEALGGEGLSKLHGQVYKPRQRTYALGSRVRLRPRKGGDAFDLVLGGQAATVEAVEEDAEGRIFLAVSVDADPGRDLAARGHPGHRFFYRVDEVEPL